MAVKRRLFILVNPTHYINAAEYVYQTGREEDHVLIITPFPAGIQRIDGFGAQAFWSSCRFHDITDYRGKGSDRKFWRDSWHWIDEAIKELRPEELVIGNLIDGILYPYLLAHKRELPPVTVLDDGTPSIDVAQKLSQGKFYWPYHYRSLRIALKCVAYLHTLPMLYSPLKRLRFFSIYQLDFRAGDELVVNQYNWLRSMVTNHATEKRFLFIGSHLVDRKLVKLQDYLNSLRFVQSQAQDMGYEMEYVFHRGESAKVREAIQSFCKTIDFDMPLELVYLHQAQPEVMAGHFTSALFTLSRIYPEMNVRAYLFPQEQLMGSEYESKPYLLEVQKALRQDARVHSLEIPFLQSS